MSLRKIFGVLLILVALFLVGLLISQYKISLSKTNPYWEAKLFQILELFRA
jgi:hypothetical protein